MGHPITGLVGPVPVLMQHPELLAHWRDTGIVIAGVNVSRDTGIVIAGVNVSRNRFRLTRVVLS